MWEGKVTVNSRSDIECMTGGLEETLDEEEEDSLASRYVPMTGTIGFILDIILQSLFTPVTTVGVHLGFQQPLVLARDCLAMESIAKDVSEDYHDDNKSMMKCIMRLQRIML